MSHDPGRRRSRDVESGSRVVEATAESGQQPSRPLQQLSESLPDAKRRRAPSPSPASTVTPPPDHATRRAGVSATSSNLVANSNDGLHSSSSRGQEDDTGSPHRAQHPHSLRQLPLALQRSPGPAVRPETSSFAGSYPSSSSYSSGTDLARLPSLSSIAQDLPVNTFPTHQSPRGLSSPISTRSNRSRTSISSRGSSPHASSSSSSSSAGRRRFGSHAPDAAALARSASQVPEFRYELVIHQQPGTAAAAGLSPPALSRLPIVPSPILQLRVTGEDGADVGHRHVLQNLPYLICSCSLVSTDETNTPIDFANEEQPLPSSVAGRASIRRPSQPLAMMCGTRVYSSSEAVGLDGQTGIYFIFWDISVRQEGEYKLKFSLVEALPGSPTLATVVSEPFRVVGRAEFPGTVEIATEWTRHMHRQGLNIYLPALGTSSSALSNSTGRS